MTGHPITPAMRNLSGCDMLSAVCVLEWKSCLFDRLINTADVDLVR
jgi:hypothetical protein